MPPQVRVLQVYLSGSEMLKGVQVIPSPGYGNRHHPEIGVDPSGTETVEGPDPERDAACEDIYGYTYLVREGHGPWMPFVRWESGEGPGKGRVIGYGSDDGKIVCKAVVPSRHRSWEEVLQIVNAFRKNLADMDVSGL